MNEQSVHLKAAITPPPSTLNTRHTSASATGPAEITAQRQVCQRGVMDSSAENSRFDANGVGHFCTDFLQKQAPVWHKAEALRSSIAVDSVTPLARVLQSREKTEILTDFTL